MQTCTKLLCRSSLTSIGTNSQISFSTSLHCPETELVELFVSMINLSTPSTTDVSLFFVPFSLRNGNTPTSTHSFSSGNHESTNQVQDRPGKWPGHWNLYDGSEVSDVKGVHFLLVCFSFVFVFFDKRSREYFDLTQLKIFYEYYRRTSITSSCWFICRFSLRSL